MKPFSQRYGEEGAYRRSHMAAYRYKAANIMRKGILLGAAALAAFAAHEYNQEKARMEADDIFLSGQREAQTVVLENDHYSALHNLPKNGEYQPASHDKTCRIREFPEYPYLDSAEIDWDCSIRETIDWWEGIYRSHPELFDGGEYFDIFRDREGLAEMVKAEIAFETRNNQRAAKYRPTQSANCGDPALPAMQGGEGYRESGIPEVVYNHFADFSCTPWTPVGWDFRHGGITPKEELRLGVGWMVHRLLYFTEEGKIAGIRPISEIPARYGPGREYYAKGVLSLLGDEWVKKAQATGFIPTQEP